ncbi:MAG: hypothetical protein HS117_07135 [Verrucomicrobiaceae bacterium]|nr:hypothetical protein [Verrucomicrobiaceae bacterium]
MRHGAEGGDSGHEPPLGRVHDYQHRPAVELYDCETDPWNRHNLIADAKLAAIRDELRAQLDAWMRQQGDEGQPTEMKALERMPKAAKEGGNEPRKEKDTGKRRRNERR